MSAAGMKELSLINKRILEVAATCREEPQIHELLKTAADTVGKAQKISAIKTQPAPVPTK